jgi:transcription antitermination factor NusG
VSRKVLPEAPDTLLPFTKNIWPASNQKASNKIRSLIQVFRFVLSALPVSVSDADTQGIYQQSFPVGGDSRRVRIQHATATAIFIKRLRQSLVESPAIN